MSGHVFQIYPIDYSNCHGMKHQILTERGRQTVRDGPRQLQVCLRAARRPLSAPGAVHDRTEGLRVPARRRLV